MKKIIPILAIAAAILFTPQFTTSAVAQSQSASAERSKAPTRVKVQRRSSRYVDTSCHTYGGYGWGPYWGPCPYRGEVYAAQPGPPVFGPFLPFGPFW